MPSFIGRIQNIETQGITLNVFFADVPIELIGVKKDGASVKIQSRKHDNR